MGPPLAILTSLYVLNSPFFSLSTLALSSLFPNNRFTETGGTPTLFKRFIICGGGFLGSFVFQEVLGGSGVCGERCACGLLHLGTGTEMPVQAAI
jgi:hypothetical protein